jgi:hypothetical protein
MPSPSPPAKYFLVLLVNDSEHSESAGAKPIFSCSCIYLVSPGALVSAVPGRKAGGRAFLFAVKYFKKKKKKKKKASSAPGYIRRE